MNKQIYFIAGVHGVGKTTYCNYLSKKYKIPHYSASQLIKRFDAEAFSQNKLVPNIGNNQQLLLSAITALVPEDKIILDGHFCLLNKSQEIQNIPSTTFSLLNLKSVLVLHDDIIKITERLENRDHLQYNVFTFETLQNAEIQYAKSLSDELGFSLHFCRAGNNSKEFELILNQSN